MRIRQMTNNRDFSGESSATRVIAPEELDFQRMKTAVHEELIESLDLSTLSHITEDQLRDEIKRLAAELCRHRRKILAAEHHQRMVDEIVNEVFTDDFKLFLI